MTLLFRLTDAIYYDDIENVTKETAMNIADRVDLIVALSFLGISLLIARELSLRALQYRAVRVKRKDAGRE